MKSQKTKITHFRNYKPHPSNNKEMTRKGGVYISKQVKYMHKHHKDIFRNVLRKISQKQPEDSTNVNHWKSNQDITKMDHLKRREAKHFMENPRRYYL